MRDNLISDIFYPGTGDADENIGIHHISGV